MKNKKWLKDAAERVAWTAAEAGLGVVIVEVSDLKYAWVAPIVVGLTMLKTLIAKRVGDPEDAKIGG
jgi:hypothetical protein